MALVTHQQLQGSYAPPRSFSLTRGIESKKFILSFPIVKRTDFVFLKHRSCLCLKTPLTKRKSLQISSFKGNIQNDESGGNKKGSNSKSTKNPVKLSYVPHDRKETFSETPKVKNNHATPISNVDETTAGSQAIQYLFRSWLTLLRTPSSPSQMADETLEEPCSNEMVETDHKIQHGGRNVILKAVWRSFSGLDAAIKIPAMIFIPLYLAVNMKYGPEVAKELTPLWICGPLLVALYIKIVQGLCLLYVYSFKQSVKVVKNLPVYYDYVVSGKLKEIIHVRVWQPVEDFRNLGYKGIWKQVQEWIVDKYLDYIESIWPHYCKLIRFLKRANFI